MGTSSVNLPSSSLITPVKNCVLFLGCKVIFAYAMPTPFSSIIVPVICDDALNENPNTAKILISCNFILLILGVSTNNLVNTKKEIDERLY